jgi:Asp-tRNA(Asn)/Glu-tRNA(Gln) amidotransferase A subunit family amidase
MNPGNDSRGLAPGQPPPDNERWFKNGSCSNATTVRADTYGPPRAGRQPDRRAAVEICLERIEGLDAELKSFLRLRADDALAEAAALDDSEHRGPLHGIPFAAKDVFDTADLPTEYPTSSIAPGLCHAGLGAG